MSPASAEPSGSPPPDGSRSIPDSGPLADRPLPRLLIELYAHRFGGALWLRHDRTEKQILFSEGAPVAAESNLASESLCARLREQGALDDEAAERVASTVRARKCREATALLGLKLVEPRTLFQAVRSQLRLRLLDCFSWSGGEYRLDPDTVPDEDVKPFRTSPLRLAADGLAERWGLDRLGPAIAERLALFPTPRPSLGRLRRHLPECEALDGALAACDGTRPLAQALGAAAASPPVLAGLWVLDAAGAFDWSDCARVAEAEEERTPEIEIEVTGSAASPPERPAAAPSRPERPLRGKAPRADVADDGEAGKLRAEIEALHAGIDEKTYYELLGVTRDTAAAGIKKAYFKAAKRFHPDALGRQGLSDLRAAAGEVFARVGEAYAVLSDPARRQDYDAELDGQPAGLDVERLAQAEALFRKGEVLLRMGDFRGALEFLTPAVELWPEEAAYQSALGWALHKKSPPETGKAIEHLEIAVEKAPDDAVARFRLGTALRAAGETQGAAEQLAHAKRLDPSVR